jgi:divalent metal cation (Fe/Co/Zn/Cd) transporter
VLFQLIYKEKIAEGKGSQKQKDKKYANQERKATLVIGVLLLILSLTVITNAIYKIANHLEPETAFFGLMVSIFSLAIMYAIYVFKLKAAKILKSPTMIADCKCTMGCMREGLTLLFGSGIQLLTINVFNS